MPWDWNNSTLQKQLPSVVEMDHEKLMRTTSLDWYQIPISVKATGCNKMHWKVSDEASIWMDLVPRSGFVILKIAYFGSKLELLRERSRNINVDLYSNGYEIPCNWAIGVSHRGNAQPTSRYIWVRMRNPESWPSKNTERALSTIPLNSVSFSHLINWNLDQISNWQGKNRPGFYWQIFN